MRVVSLLPSATDALLEIGAADLLVGRSHECDAPEIADRPVLTAPRTVATTSAAIDAEVRSLAEGDATSLYELDTEALAALAPDVILTQDICKVCSIDLQTVRRAAAAMPGPPVIVSLDPSSIEDVFEDVWRVGEAVGRTDAAEGAVVRLRDRFWSAVDYVNPYIDGPRLLVLEWIDPLFVAGHWTPDLVSRAGAQPVLAEPGAASREVTPEDVVAARPDRIVICPCGMTAEQAEAELPGLTAQDWWAGLPAVVAGEVEIVDGQRGFSRPGPGLVEHFVRLVEWINGVRVP